MENDRIERIMQDTGMERLQAMRHEQQRISLARAYADHLKHSADECAAIYADRLARDQVRKYRVKVTPVPEVWRATLTRPRWGGLARPMIITTNANPSHGDALYDLRAMVGIVTGQAFCVRLGDVVSVARVGVAS